MIEKSRSERTRRLYKDVCADYNKMCQVKEHGVQKYTDAYIIRHLALKYYRSPKTIENIVFGRVSYPKSQLSV